MYFPYFRGKQYELIVLRELVDLLAGSRITPVIEPVKSNLSSLRRTLEVFKEKNLNFTLIINPRKGDLKGDGSVLEREIIAKQLGGYPNYFLGFILSDKTSLDDIKSLFIKYPKQKIALIHYHTFEKYNDLNVFLNKQKNFAFNIFIEGATTKTYRENFKDTGKRVLLSNSFKSKPRNQDYPEHESFSDLFKIYKKEGYDGFGDFLIVGDDYYETGGPAYVIAIHLTYLNDQVIWIKHFLSDSDSGSPVDPGGKFFEALQKLIKFIDSLKLNTMGCEEFRALYRSKQYPGLGVVKKISMKHHIELISSLIKNG